MWENSMYGAQPEGLTQVEAWNLCGALMIFMGGGSRKRVSEQIDFGHSWTANQVGIDMEPVLVVIFFFFVLFFFCVSREFISFVTNKKKQNYVCWCFCGPYLIHECGSCGELVCTCRI